MRLKHTHQPPEKTQQPKTYIYV